ncbi:MAG: phosphoribosylanthranilate isomerase [Bacteroidota bacterium]
MITRLKVCCISSVEEAQLAIQMGVHALGLVGEMPSGPGVISDATIQQIAQTVPPGVSSFLLTSDTTATGIIDHQKRTGANTLQLVDALTEGTHTQIKEALPGIKVVQVVHVLDEQSVDEALAAAETADALLLDSGNPNQAVKVLGGTGKTHNWNVSRQIVEQTHVPVFLAGGIRAHNVRQAIDEVQPYGIDLCTGVRTEDTLDPVKLEAVLKAMGF